jgi:glycosyltransferase 2 family protein
MRSRHMTSWSTRKVLVALAVGIPVSAVFLWFAVRNADPAAVKDSLQRAEPGVVTLAVAAMMAVYALQAARWRNIASTPRVPLWRFYEMVVSGIACNNVLPARLGDLLRARWLGLEAQMPAGRGLGTVVLDRACDLAALLLLLAIGLAAVASTDWLLRIVLVGAFALLVVATSVVFARVYTGRRERGRRARGLVRRVIRDVAEMLAEPIGRRRPIVWMLLSMSAWTTWAVGAMLVARSLDVDLGLVDALFVAAVMNLGVAIPSSPGFVGTYEWLGVASLGLLGVASNDALAFAILLHACWYVPTTVAGGVALGLRGLAGLRRARSTRTATRAAK